MGTTGKSANNISTGTSTGTTPEPTSESSGWTKQIARAVVAQAIADAINADTNYKDGEKRRVLRRQRLEAIRWFSSVHCQEVCTIAGISHKTLLLAIEQMLRGTPAQKRYIAGKLKKQLLDSLKDISTPE